MNTLLVIIKEARLSGNSILVVITTEAAILILFFSVKINVFVQYHHVTEIFINNVCNFRYSLLCLNFYYEYFESSE